MIIIRDENEFSYRIPKIGDPDHPFTLSEMAHTKDKIFQNLLYKTEVVFEHLLKLFYFHSCTDYVNGWITTVYSNLSKTHKDKATNKWPTEEFIYDAVWGGAEDAFSAHLRGMVGTFNYKNHPSYKYLPTIVNKREKEAKQYLTEYYRWLSKQLSKKGEVKLFEVETIIKQLLKKYAK